MTIYNCSANELLAATMGAISSVLGCDLANTGLQSRWCYKQCDLGGALGGAISLVLGCDKTSAIWGWGRCWVRRDQWFWCDLLAVSLSLSSIFLGWKSFEGKIKPENELRVRQGILQSMRKMNSI